MQRQTLLHTRSPTNLHTHLFPLLSRDTVSTSRSLEVGCGSDNVDGEGLESKRLEKVLGLGVDIEGGSLGVEGRDLGDEVVLSLSLLLLKLERDTADGTSLNPLHQVGGESSNLVSKTLGRNDGNLIADLLVGVEIESKTGVVLLDNNSRSSLDGFGSYSSPG